MRDRPPWLPLRDHSSEAAIGAKPNNSLQLTRLACGELASDLPARMRENEWAIA
jgi:hypothetical protein